LDLDLVEVAPDANPPVCRIMDYNRFKYETAQRAKESRKKATNTSIKEMKYRPKIGTGDFTTKTRQVGRFLEEGHKVKVTIMFRGREVSHPELGMKLLEDLADQVSAVSKVEAAPKLDGRNMVMVLAPDRRAKATRKPSDRSATASEGGTPETEATSVAAASPPSPGAEPPGIPDAPAAVPAAEPVPVGAAVTAAGPGAAPAPAGPANGARRGDGHSTRPRTAVIAASGAPADGASGTTS
jgi:translation initiation factor IF-3